VEPAQDSAQGDASLLASEAEAAGADSWLSISVGGEWSALELGVQSFDLISKAMVADLSVVREGWQSEQDLALETWNDIVQPIAAHYHMVETAVAQQGPPRALLSVRALPGTKISGLGGLPLFVDESGTASREVPAARQYTLGASLVGYIFSSRQIYLEADRVVSFEQSPESHWTAEAAFQDRAYPGVGLAWSLRPGVFSFKLGITTYLVGLAFDANGVFASQPLSEIILQATAYWFPGASDFRFYTGEAFYLRIDHPAGSRSSLDALSFGGIKGIIGTELMVSPRGRLFFEYTATVYFGVAPELFKASLGPDKTPPGWVFTPTTAMNLLSFRAGYRWQL
jgi:hypothetical protein